MSKSAFGLSVLGRKKPKRKGYFSMMLNRSGWPARVELIAALHKWISIKRPDLRGIVSGEEFETFKREFFDSQGAQTFEVVIDFLEKSKLAYAKQHKPPAKTRLRSIGERTPPETLKASKMAQEYRANGERVSWRRIAKKVSSDPGKPLTRSTQKGEVIEATWARRVQRLRDSVKNYERRQREKGEGKVL
jgi:hypothetical protein